MNLTELVKRCLRILIISRKPTHDEFTKVAKVTSIGVIVIGLVGVVVAVIFGFIG
ncbi:MAG: protein translocase SEC61 complex subunit gamma [Candidatus Micrarchaeota archaeon]